MGMDIIPGASAANAVAATSGGGLTIDEEGMIQDPTAMSEARKQEMAEWLSYSTVIAAYTYQNLKRNGSTAELSAFQESVRRNVLTSGIDLKHVELTDGGLVAH